MLKIQSERLTYPKSLLSVEPITKHVVIERQKNGAPVVLNNTHQTSPESKLVPIQSINRAHTGERTLSDYQYQLTVIDGVIDSYHARLMNSNNCERANLLLVSDK